MSVEDKKWDWYYTKNERNIDFEHNRIRLSLTSKILPKAGGLYLY